MNLKTWAAVLQDKFQVYYKFIKNGAVEVIDWSWSNNPCTLKQNAAVLAE